MTTGLPTDVLSPAARDWCTSVGSSATTLTEALQDAVVLTEIDKNVELVNSQAVSAAHVVKKWRILPRDFSIAGGELGKLTYRVAQKRGVDKHYIDPVGWHLHRPCRPLGDVLTPDPIRPTRRGPDPNRPTRRAIFFQNWH